MPRSSSRVIATDRDVKKTTPNGTRGEWRVQGVRNLILRVAPTGGKAWCFRFRLAAEHKWRAITLGSWPTISLCLAKADALKLTLALRDGKDPRTLIQRHLRLSKMTFREMAMSYLAMHEIECARNGQKSVWTREVERMLRALV